MALQGIVGAVHTIAVQEARPRLRQIGVPDIVGALMQRDPLQLAAPGRIEYAELNFRGVA